MTVKNKLMAAFSLVELSIVLVILGLLTGGILAGQSLIRASELRSVGVDHSRYITAVATFRDKYFAIPGDMGNAQSFWGVADATAANCITTVGTGTQTCNGDNDGTIDISTGANEYFRFWQHLANAGLVEGSFTGTEGSSGNFYDTVPGTNAPRSKMGNASWLPRYVGVNSGHGERFNGNYNNTLMFGDSAGTAYPSGAILKPEEAWNLDTKSDDGKPATGNVVPADRVGCSVRSDGSAITTSVGDAGLTSATYALSATSNLCALLFINIG